MAPLALLMLTGCGKQNSLVGTWIAETFNATTRRVETISFGSDNRYQDITVVSTPLSKASLTATDTGTWKQQGKNGFSVAVSDVDWIPSGAAPDRLKKAREKFLKAKPKLLDNANQAGKLETIKWVNPDTFTFEEAGTVQTFHRKS